jgi:hypothetical protein
MRDLAMKKFFGVLLAALVIALLLWVALRVAQAHRRVSVEELLPKTTLLLAHAPDPKKTREEWHESDLYAIWREATVQAWLREPLAQLNWNHRGGETLNEFLQLGPTDGFLALTSLENNEPRIVGGFHFAKAPAAVRRFIEERKARWLARLGEVKRETVPYEKHQIETIHTGRLVLASVYDRDWFFAANDLKALEALLDRADRRAPKESESLRENDTFKTATKNLPSNYAAMFFLEPQPFLEKVMPLIAMTGQHAATSQLQRLRDVRSVAGTFGFDHGKMSESVFVAMPRPGPQEQLTRPSLATASSDTFFYSATLSHWLAAWPLSASPGWPALLRQAGSNLVQKGISQEDLAAAFGDEVELFGEWAPQAHWPTFTLTLPVKDAGQARKVADALASGELAGATWTRTEKEGVTYYNLTGFGGFVPISPAIALSDRKLVAGSDAGTVETDITRKVPPAEALEKGPAFREATSRVAAAGSAFNYVDTRLLFERADAALRPLLLMSATIYPALGKQFDVANLPPADAVAKHLSPIVMSQRYTGDGYLSQSVGPITFNEATVGLAGVAGALYIYLQKGLNPGKLLAPGPGTPAPASPSIPTPTPSATPP